MKKYMTILITFTSMLFAYGSLVDTDNNPATTNTVLGNIDMSAGTLGDLAGAIAPAYNQTSNRAANAVNQLAVTNIIKDIVTNIVVVGYTDWKYSGNMVDGVTYSITSEPSGNNYVFTLWNATAGTSLGTVTTNELNALALSFTVPTGTINAQRSRIERNANGLAMYSDVQKLSDKIDSMDTSYYRVVGITNKNQSVQYVYTDSSTTTLSIQIPSSGMTKDWLVYVLAEADLQLVLPPANYWVVSESVTNGIPAATPTALYFSQITDDTYSIGRQELIPITVETPLMLLNQAIRRKAKYKTPIPAKTMKALSR